MADLEGRDRPFIALIAWLRDCSSAFDAADRGYHREAKRLLTEACAGMRALMDDEPAIEEVIPELRRHLDNENPFFDTAELAERAQSHIDAMRAE